MSAAAPILELSGVTKRFGGLTAVSDVSFTVPAGELLGIIGPNGAGKTTLFNVISGYYRPEAGRIVFAGRAHDATRARRAQSREPSPASPSGTNRTTRMSTTP